MRQYQLKPENTQMEFCYADLVEMFVNRVDYWWTDQYNGLYRLKDTARQYLKDNEGKEGCMMGTPMDYVLYKFTSEFLPLFSALTVPNRPNEGPWTELIKSYRK